MSHATLLKSDSAWFRLQDFHFLRLNLSRPFNYLTSSLTYFGLFPFRSPLLWKSNFFFLFVWLLRCFSSPTFPSCCYVFTTRYLRFAQVGFPIRTFPDLRIFAPPRDFSQLVTSFFGSQCQGIHLMPLVAWPEIYFSLIVRFLGGDEEIRTPDPLLARQVLSQLSYTPKMFFCDSKKIFWGSCVPSFEIYKNLFLFKFHRLGAPPFNNY